MWRQVLDNVIAKTLNGFSERLTSFGPNLLAMLVILVAGILGAAAIRLLVRLLLPRLGFDRFAQRVGISVVLQKGGITTPPSAVLGAVLAWGVLGVFVLLAIAALNLQVAMSLVSQAFAYLPQLLIAVAILILGAAVSGFVRRSVLIAAVNAGLPSARLLAGGAQVGLMVLFVAMALEHLGVGRQVILVSFTILFGGVVLALSLAFGMAGRDLARDALDRLARRREHEAGDDIRHL